MCVSVAFWLKPLCPSLAILAGEGLGCRAPTVARDTPWGGVKGLEASCWLDTIARHTENAAPPDYQRHQRIDRAALAHVPRINRPRALPPPPSPSPSSLLSLVPWKSAFPPRWSMQVNWT